MFGYPTYLRAGGSIYYSSAETFPYPADWNGDGVLDLLCGDYNGRVMFFENTGTASVPVFASPVFLNAGGAQLDVGYDASPVAVDWNGDGVKDLLVGNSYGYVYYFENQGTNAAPVLAAGTRVKAGGSNLDIGSEARIDVADYNGDGLNDLIVGDDYGYVTVYVAIAPQPPSFAGYQGAAIVSSGHFYAAMYNYNTSALVDWVDTTDSGTLGGSIVFNQWYGSFIYDYDSAAYSEALYLYGN